MFKTLLVIATLALGLQAHAALTQVESQAIISTITQPAIFDDLFIVGESADYKLDGGFIQGKVHMLVREATADGYWLQQDLDLGAMGAHKAEVLYDKNTGKVTKILMDGKEQQIPDQSQMKVIASHKDHITVPKGAFDCMYVKIHDNSKNEDSEVWISPLVSVAHMVKTISPSPVGNMTIELTDFLKK